VSLLIKMSKTKLYAATLMASIGLVRDAQCTTESQPQLVAAACAVERTLQIGAGLCFIAAIFSVFEVEHHWRVSRLLSRLDKSDESAISSKEMQHKVRCAKRRAAIFRAVHGAAIGMAVSTSVTATSPLVIAACALSGVLPILMIRQHSKAHRALSVYERNKVQGPNKDAWMTIKLSTLYAMGISGALAVVRLGASMHLLAVVDSLPRAMLTSQ
jgi:hypothetical protein